MFYAHDTVVVAGTKGSLHLGFSKLHSIPPDYIMYQTLEQTNNVIDFKGKHIKYLSQK